jgi:hypothetical protein
MFTEQEVRKRVKLLKRFYMDVVTYGIVNAALILIWLGFDSSGSFWPKYVLIVWGLILVFKAYKMEVIPVFCYHIAFLNPEWEDKKVAEIIGKKLYQHKVPLKRDIKKQPPSR